MKTPLPFLVVLGWALAAPVLAQPKAAQSGSQGGYFSCRDASGRLITSDRPIMECLEREQRVHNADGSLRRVIEAPLSAEQKKAREEEEKKKLAAQQKIEEQRARDRILLSSYTSIESLELARRRALGDSESFLDRSRKRLDDLTKEKKALEGEQEFYKTKGIPATLTRRMEDNAFGIRYESDSITKRQEEIVRINQRFETDKARLTELLAGKK